MTRDTVARTIHEMISGFKVSIGEQPYGPYPENDKVYVDFLKGAIDFVKFRDSVFQYGCQPRDIHDYWMEWAKDNRPGHASLISFDEMSTTERMKDDFIIHIVRTFLKYDPEL